MKRSCIVVLAIMTMLLGLGLSAFAAEYPTKPINLVIQYPAGGSTDLTARALANGAKKYLGQP
ncbi:MAG TPA: tripartite tricarboxylate transporter substrate binding protein, partial [Thermodesulfobacteriota bacterium]|nr:tripartite tricarboxylate transporter substrate binding protein [Thermodesulfobacteriota bacterium]